MPGSESSRFVRMSRTMTLPQPAPPVVEHVYVPAPSSGVLTAGGVVLAIAAYLTVPVYAAFHEWLGRDEILADMWRLWKDGDRKGALAAIPDSLVDELIDSALEGARDFAKLADGQCTLQASGTTLGDVVNHYDAFFVLALSDQEKSDLVEYLKSL